MSADCDPRELVRGVARYCGLNDATRTELEWTLACDCPQPRGRGQCPHQARSQRRATPRVGHQPAPYLFWASHVLRHAGAPDDVPQRLVCALRVHLRATLGPLAGTPAEVQASAHAILADLAAGRVPL